MRTFIIVTAMMMSGYVIAAGAPVSNQFIAGDPIIANDVNANFQELADRIDVNSTAISQMLEGQLRQIVGFSTTTVTGHAGLKAITEACSSDFPGSRICTSEEIVKSTNFPSITPYAEAWVLPVLSGSGNPGSEVNTAPALDKYSGIGFNDGRYLTCGGWAGSNLQALVVTTEFRFMLVGCASARNVACCL